MKKKRKKSDPFDVPQGHANWKNRKQGAFKTKAKEKPTRKQRKTTDE